MERAHSSHPNYLLVGAALIALTFLEVIVVGLPVPPLPFLLLFGGMKGLLIALFFMHLKYDLSLYARLFAIGVVGGLLMVVSLIVVLTSHLT